MALGFEEATPDEGKRYKHNVEIAANNPYIIVSAYEGQCAAGHYPPIPQRVTSLSCSRWRVSSSVSSSSASSLSVLVCVLLGADDGLTAGDWALHIIREAWLG